MELGSSLNLDMSLLVLGARMQGNGVSLSAIASSVNNANLTSSMNSAK